MSRESDTSRRILKGAAILTLAALIVKILSAVYRIPFQNMAGDTGFYIYQQVYPFYGIAVVLATYGFPVALSKLLVENRANEKREIVRKQIITASFIWVLFIGIILFSLLFFGAEHIASIMNDTQLVPLVRTVAFSFLLMPFISIARGSYQADGNMIPTALSQTFEQLLRVTFILVGTYLLMRYGASLYMVGEGAIVGSLVGGVAATLVLAYYLRRAHGDLRLLIMPEGELLKRIGKVLLFQGLAFCLNNMYLLLLQLIDSFQIYSSLIEQGIPANEAKMLKGVYDRGQPLIQVGLVVATSLSLSLVPLLTSLQNRKAVKEVKAMCHLAIKVSFAVGVGASVGLLGILQSVNIMLFKDDKGFETLSVLAMFILLASLLVTSSTILQTMGYWKVSVLIILLSFILKGSLNPWLISEYGIIGAAYSSLFALIIACVMLLHCVERFVSGSAIGISHLVRLVIAAVVMYIMLKGYTVLFASLLGESMGLRKWATIHAVSSVGIGVVVYLFTLFKIQLFQKEELIHLPGGQLLIEVTNKGKFKR